MLTGFVANCIGSLETTMSSAGDKSLFVSVLGDVNKHETLYLFHSLWYSCLWCHSSGISGRQHPAASRLVPFWVDFL